MGESGEAADRVGGLLRPESLLDARWQQADGKIGDWVS
jgi:hypothetical protein